MNICVSISHCKTSFLVFLFGWLRALFVFVFLRLLQSRHHTSEPGTMKVHVMASYFYFMGFNLVW